jgi:hypothetical protein
LITAELIKKYNIKYSAQAKALSDAIYKKKKMIEKLLQAFRIFKLQAI